MVASVLAELRDLAPKRPLTWVEGLRVAELQADRLVKLSGIREAPVPEEVITDLPRITVERPYPFKVSGVTAWSEGVWMIALNGGEPETRQRFSLAHEFKHVIDGPAKSYLYPPQLGFSSHERAEGVANHFAACLLMPHMWVKRAWASGIQDVRQLARIFEVSPEAMRVRLTTMGLIAPYPRCGTAA